MAKMKEVKRTQLRKPYVPGVKPANTKTFAEIKAAQKERRLGDVAPYIFDKYL